MYGQRFSFQATGGPFDGDLDSSVLKLSASVRLSSSYAELLSVIPLTPCSPVERLKIHAGSVDRPRRQESCRPCFGPRRGRMEMSSAALQRGCQS